MSSALDCWRTQRLSALDEIEIAHRGIGGSGRGRRYATQELNYGYAMLLSSHFQAFCRELHSECANFMVTALAPLALKLALRDALLRGRKLDQGNANPGNLGSDFAVFGLKFWEKVKKLDSRNQARQSLLETLNVWRNAIAHRDFSRMPEGPTLHLQRVRAWRAACNQLAGAFDDVMRGHLQAVTGTAPW